VTLSGPTALLAVCGSPDYMDVIADLVLMGFATANQETMRVGGRKIQVARVRIMDAGRRELEADSPVR
jgi:hypothetical protein